MSQQPTQKPSLGRVVLFSQSLDGDSRMAPAGVEPGREYAADVVKVDDETGHVFLHVKTLSLTCPIVVATAPITAETADVWGCSWRWPPRV